VSGGKRWRATASGGDGGIGGPPVALSGGRSRLALGWCRGGRCNSGSTRRAAAATDGRRARGSKFWCGHRPWCAADDHVYGRSIEHALEAFHIDRREWGASGPCGVAQDVATRPPARLAAYATDAASGATVADPPCSVQPSTLTSTSRRDIDCALCVRRFFY
jgi:hypothetical protein